MSSLTQNMSSSQILDAVKKLPNSELDDFVKQVLVLSAKNRARSMPEAETRLLKTIYRKFSDDKLSRLRALKEKRQIVELSEEEYAEFSSLTEALEEFQARRMTTLVKLAKRRGVSLEEVMAQIGIRFPDYD